MKQLLLLILFGFLSTTINAQQAQLQKPKDIIIPLSVNLEELDKIIGALGKLPAEQVYTLIGKLNYQAEQVLRPKTKPKDKKEESEQKDKKKN